MLCILVVLVLSFVTYISAADDFLQKKLKEDAQWSQVVARVSEIIEAAEDVMIYTENPPQLDAKC